MSTPVKLRGKQRQVWRSLIWAALFFLAIQQAGGVLLDYCWPDVRFATARYLFQALGRRPKPPDVIALGSSRFGLAFFAPEAGAILRQRLQDEQFTAFNASVPSGDLITADFMMERLLREGHRPRLVVVEISPETVGVFNDWMGYHVTRQLRWDDLPAYLHDVAVSGTIRRLLKHRLFPLAVYAAPIARYFAPGTLSCGPGVDMATTGVTLASAEDGPDCQGLFGNVIEALRKAGQQPGLSQSQAGLPTIRRWLRNYRVGGTAAAALERFLERCRQNQIHVILVGVPLHSTHRAFYSPEIEGAFRSYLAQVARVYPCRFADYRDQVPDHLFLDNHHLLPDGNRYFTRRLTEEVLVPAWRGR